MRAVIQRVKTAKVIVNDCTVSEIGQGLVVLLGVEKNDDIKDADYMAGKIAELRIFPDEKSHMNRSIKDVNGSVLVISQFTLLGDARKGRRPSFTNAAEAEFADDLYNKVCKLIEDRGIIVKKGVFGANMQVCLVNDGPVTILLDSRRLF